MARPVAESSLKSEFNAFLFAPIGKNSDGMQVSVLSGLAQSELDPWAEAAELALLPVKNAVERLALLIGKMPDKGWAYPETGCGRDALDRAVAQTIFRRDIGAHLRWFDEFKALVGLCRNHVLCSGLSISDRQSSGSTEDR